MLILKFGFLPSKGNLSYRDGLKLNIFLEVSQHFERRVLTKGGGMKFQNLKRNFFKRVLRRTRL